MTLRLAGLTEEDTARRHSGTPCLQGNYKRIARPHFLVLPEVPARTQERAKRENGGTPKNEKTMLRRGK